MRALDVRFVNTTFQTKHGDLGLAAGERGECVEVPTTNLACRAGHPAEPTQIGNPGESKCST
jgi:hypothetical protein